MEFKELLDVSNAVWAAMVRAVEMMGIDLKLLLTNELGYVLANDIEGLMKDAGLFFAEDNIENTVNKYIEVMKTVGFCQTSELLNHDDEKIVIKLGQCVFATGCENIRNKSSDNTSPCPMIAILLGNLEKINKGFFVDEATYDKTTGSTTFLLRSSF